MDTRKPSDVDRLYTPQPVSLSKTFNKMNQKPFQHRLNEANASLDFIPHLEKDPNKRASDVHKQLQEQRELAEKTLKRASGKFNSVFRTPAREDSTVNESDLLRMSSISNFGQNVQVSSTPRNSARDSLSSVVIAKQVAQETRRQSEMFESLIHKLKTSDITISEVCKEFQEKMGHSICSDIKEVDSDFFVPAEQALEKIKADELSWRKEKDLPIEHFTEFSRLSDNSFKDKVSVGEFFQQRSEDISKLMPSVSPEKTHEPVPLVENSRTYSNIMEQDSARESLSVTEIAKLLSEMNDDNTSSVISHLLKANSKKTTRANKENVSPNRGSSMSTTVQINSSRMSLPIPSLNSTACQTAGSSERESDISPRMQHDKSMSSLRSGSALSSLPDGKLPIETTRTQLVWGCVRLGKSSTQEFVVRNRSQHRLRVQVTTNTMEFKLLKDKNESEPSNILKILLRPLESRTLAVNFCPSAKGAFAGELDFAPLDADLIQSKKQMIYMYGYGGHASVELYNNIARDPTGKFLLPLGDLSNKISLTKTITCRNNGTLTGFVLATFEPKSVCSSVSVLILPNKFVIKPQQEIGLSVTYTATKEDITYFQNSAIGNVFELGVIKLYTEAEATRGRLRCLVNKAEKHKLDVKPIVRELTQSFRYENVPGDILKCRESVCGINQLLRQVYLREIVVTIEHDYDATLVSMDDTSVFQTLCGDSSNYTYIKK